MQLDLPKTEISFLYRERAVGPTTQSRARTGVIKLSLQLSGKGTRDAMKWLLILLAAKLHTGSTNKE